MGATPAAEALRERLQDIALRLACPLAPHQSRALLGYLGLLQRWNRTYNLTAVRDPEAMLTQHLADCLAIVAPLRRVLGDRAAKIVDVGSGGGLPAAVLALVEPRWTVIAVDAVGKKAAFVQQVAAEVGAPNLRALHARVETMSEADADLVVTRAFADLATICSTTTRLLKPGGLWAAMKARVAAEELSALPADIDVFHVEQLHVPGLDAERCLVWMRPRPPVPSP